MKFIPHPLKVEIKPHKKERIILAQDENLIEAGEVISVGDQVTFLKVGDIVFFDGWGCSKTPDVNGIIHYVLSVNEDVILGKYEKTSE